MAANYISDTDELERELTDALQELQIFEKACDYKRASVIKASVENMRKSLNEQMLEKLTEAHATKWETMLVDQLKMEEVLQNEWKDKIQTQKQSCHQQMVAISKKHQIEMLRCSESIEFELSQLKPKESSQSLNLKKKHRELTKMLRDQSRSTYSPKNGSSIVKHDQGCYGFKTFPIDKDSNVFIQSIYASKTNDQKLREIQEKIQHTEKRDQALWTQMILSKKQAALNQLKTRQKTQITALLKRLESTITAYEKQKKTETEKLKLKHSNTQKELKKTHEKELTQLRCKLGTKDMHQLKLRCVNSSNNLFEGVNQNYSRKKNYA